METRPTRVYYNSACPVCNAGIEDARRRIESRHAMPVEWIDVHRAPERVDDVGETLERVRERLHVRTPDGALHVGAGAIGALCARTPGRGWLAALLRLPLARGVSVLAYDAFARLLYNWNRRRRHW